MKKGLFTGRWTLEEHSKFLQGISIPSFCWSEVSQVVGTRSAAQCKSHYQKLNAGAKPKPKPRYALVLQEKSQKHSKEIQCNSTEDSLCSESSPVGYQQPRFTKLTWENTSTNLMPTDAQLTLDNSELPEFEFKEDHFELYNF